MYYRIFRSFREVLSLEDAWNALLPSQAVPFAAFDWNLAWLQSYEERYDNALIFVFYAHDEPSVIFPFYRRDKQIRFIGDEVCDYNDVLAANREVAKVAFRQVQEYAADREYHFWFPKVASHSMAFEILAECKRSDTFHAYSRLYCPAPYVHLPDTWDAFYGGLSKNLRRSLGRTTNKLAREVGEVEFRFYDGERITDQLLRKIASLHIHNQFRKEGDSIFEDRDYVRLLSLAAPSTRTGLFVATLEHAGQPLAFVLGCLREKNLFNYICAYDGAYSKCNPGKILISRLIRFGIEREGLKTFDFLNGAEPYKYDWAREETQIFHFALYPRTPLNGLKRNALELRDYARRRARRVLLKSGVHERLGKSKPRTSNTRNAGLPGKPATGAVR